MNKLLIMGGSYFIGKHVVETLKDSYDTFVLNRGSRPLNDPKVTELVCDRNDHETLKTQLAPHVFTHVVDISSFNEDQSKGLLDALDLDALETFVFISTSAVYDIEKNTPPFKETDTLGGASPFKDYAKHKILAENFLAKALKSKQLTVFRPPFVYGEDNYILRERLFFYLIENDLPIYVPKSNNRIQFVYVKDLANDVKHALTKKIPAGIYNVGYDHAETFTEYIDHCAAVVGKPANRLFFDHEAHQIKLTHLFPFFTYDNVLSVKKIKAHAPKDTPIKRGLQHAYQDYLLVKETLALPPAMREARKKLATAINSNKPVR